MGKSLSEVGGKVENCLGEHFFNNYNEYQPE